MLSIDNRFLITLAPQVLNLTWGEKDYLLFPVIGKGGHVVRKTVEGLSSYAFLFFKGVTF